MTGIYAAMNAVMSDVQAIGKNQRVTEGPARFSFRGVDDVVKAVGPVLREHKVVVVPHEVMSLEHERYTTKSGALMDGVTVVIRWRFYAADGSFIEASSAGQSSDSGDKGVPKAHSVAYRTVLLQALCIPTDEPDPDSSVHERGAAVPTRADQAADEAAERAKALGAIKGVADQIGWSKGDVEDDYAARYPGEQFGRASVRSLIDYLAVLGDLPTQPTLAGA